MKCRDRNILTKQPFSIKKAVSFGDSPAGNNNHKIGAHEMHSRAQAVRMRGNADVTR